MHSFLSKWLPTQEALQAEAMHAQGATPAERVMHTGDAFLRKFINLWLVMSIGVTIYIVLFTPQSLYVGLGALLCFGMTKLCMYLGHPVAARWALALPLASMAVVAPWLVNGLRTPVLVNIFISVLLTGWVLGVRAMWGFTLAFGASLLAMELAESHGWWHMPQPLRGPTTWFMALFSSLVTCSAIMSALIRNYRSDIQRETVWQERLRSEMQFNSQVIEQSPVPMLVLNAQGHCTSVNQAYLHLLGSSREALLHHPLAQAGMPHAGIAAAAQAALETGQSSDHSMQVHTADGRSLWLHAYVVPCQRDQQPHVLVNFIDFTERHNAAKELEKLAFNDSLTGLANRRRFFEHLQYVVQISQRNQQWGVVFLLDMNRFKALNDQYGHDVGDQMLREVSLRLKRSLRASDLVARLGGDEFTVILYPLGDSPAVAQQQAQKLMRKLEHVLSLPYRLGAITHHSSASIGMALIDPSDRCDVETLLHRADGQMYERKRQQAATAHAAIGTGDTVLR